MIRSCRIPLLILCLTLCATADIFDFPATAGELSQVLLLKNGNVLKGEINQQGQYFWVKMTGGQLRVPADQVDLVCKNLENAYQQRRASRTASSADSHLELARWCMHHDMYENASKEIAEAQSIEPDNRQLPLLSRQLAQLIKFSNHQASATENVKNSADETLLSKEIDEALLEKTPKWARAIFVRQVQPLLVHSCATTGCHQSGDAFQLNRLAVDGAGHSELTMQNLSTTLSYIDWQEPAQSDLLKRAIAAHGEAGMKPLPSHKMQILSMWVDQIVQANIQQDEEILLAEKQIEQTAKPLPKTNSEISDTQVQPAHHVQRDPFDADFFNQGYAQRTESVQLAIENETTELMPVAGSLAAPPPLATPGE